jgi:hypothetical protein
MVTIEFVMKLFAELVVDRSRGAVHLVRWRNNLQNVLSFPWGENLVGCCQLSCTVGTILQRCYFMKMEKANN